MKFTSLSVENFKRFAHAHIEFAPNVTVVKGPNEAGKSSIQAAILVALFLNPRSPGDEIAEYTRWGQDRQARLVLEFEHQDITYMLEKDFEQGTISLLWSGKDREQGYSDSPSEVLTLIGRLLGTLSADTYINTACIRSDEVSQLPAANAPLSQRLQAKVTSGRHANATEVLHLIDGELAAMAAGSLRRSQETGTLRLARERVERLRIARDTAAERLRAFEENSTTLFRLRQELRQVQHEADTSMQRLDLSDRAQTLEEDMALLVEHVEELREAAHPNAGFPDVIEHLSTINYDVLRSALERARELERHIQDERAREGEINHQLAVLALTQMQRRPGTLRIVLIAVGVVLIAAGATAASLTHMIVLAVISLLGVALLVRALSSTTTTGIDSSSRYSDDLNTCIAEIAATKEKLQRLFATFGLTTIKELEAVEREMRPQGEARTMRQQRIALLLGEQRERSRQEAIEHAVQQIVILRQELASLSHYRLNPEAYAESDQHSKSLQSRRSDLQREVYRLEGELGAAEINSEVLATIDEDLSAEYIRLARMERRRKGLERARSGIREALSTTLTQTSAMFRSGLTKHLARITDGRYDKVEAHIDQDGLELLIYTADHGQAVPINNLSRATQDQIYLAARLALLELVTEGRKPPLLLDDPFVNYDDERLENTIALLRELYSEHQIILFTCTNRYDRFADHVVELGAHESAYEPTPTSQAAAS